MVLASLKHKRKYFATSALLCTTLGQKTCLCLLPVVFKPSDEWSRACTAQLSPCSYSQNFNFDSPGDRVWITYEAWGCLHSVAQHVLLFQVDFQAQRTTYFKCCFKNTTHPLDYFKKKQTNYFPCAVQRYLARNSLGLAWFLTSHCAGN